MSLGNPTNPDGTRGNAPVSSSSAASPGRITRGPAHNKVKMHLIASHGKMPAEIYAHAVAARQKLKPRMPAKILKHGQLQKKPGVPSNPAHMATPKGVAPKPKSFPLPNIPDRPGDSPAVENAERRRGMYT